MSANLSSFGLVRWIAHLLCLGFIVLSNGLLNGQEMTAKSLLTAYVETVDQRHEAVTEALAVFKTGDFEHARQLLDEAVETDSGLPPAGILLTRMFIAAGQPGLARTELDRVALEHPDDPEAYLGTAEVAVAQKRYADAELAFRRATELGKEAPLSPYRTKNMLMRIRLGLAAISESQENWSDTVEHLKPIVDADIRNSDAVAMLARSLFKIGERGSAFRLLQKHWETNKAGIQRPELTQGLFFQEAGDKEKAAQSIKIAAERDIANVSTQSFVATWALEQGDFELAESCAGRALKLSGSSIQSRLLMALVSRYKSDFPAAREMLESVHLESPANLAAVIELAIVLGNIVGMENQSLQYAQVAVKLQPDLNQPAGRNAAMTLAWVLNNLGAQADAETIVLRVLSAGPVGVETSYYAGKVLIAGENKAAGRRLLKQAIDSGRVFPGYADAKAIFDQAN